MKHPHQEYSEDLNNLKSSKTKKKSCSKYGTDSG